MQDTAKIQQGDRRKTHAYTNRLQPCAHIHTNTYTHTRANVHSQTPIGPTEEHTSSDWPVEA